MNEPRLQILTAALLFSTGGAAIKYCSLSSWQVASFRSGIAALTVLLLIPASRRFWSPRALMVGAAYAATMILFVTGNKLTTAANTIFLQSTAPLYMLLLSPWLLGEPIRPRDVGFMAALAVGMGALFLGANAPPMATAPKPPLGNLLAALSGVTWALTIVGLRWMGRGHAEDVPSAGPAVVAGNVIAFVTCLPWALPVQGGRASDGLALVYLGVFQIGIAYLSLTAGIRKVRALDAVLLLLLEPVLNPVWAWLVHGEVPGGWSVVGGAIILAGTLAKALISPRE